jgi:hypothetical protein
VIEMEIKVDNELTILLEAETVLVKHLGPSKTARFFAAWRQGAGDYLQIREKLFARETLDTLYDKILLFQSKWEEAK